MTQNRTTSLQNHGCVPVVYTARWSVYLHLLRHRLVAASAGGDRQDRSLHVTVSEVASGLFITSRFAVTHGHTLSSTIIPGLFENAGTLIETFGDRSNKIEPRTAPGIRTSIILRQKWSIFTLDTRAKIYNCFRRAFRRVQTTTTAHCDAIHGWQFDCQHVTLYTSSGVDMRRWLGETLDLDSSTLWDPEVPSPGKYCVNSFYL